MAEKKKIKLNGDKGTFTLTEVVDILEAAGVSYAISEKTLEPKDRTFEVDATETKNRAKPDKTEEAGTA